MAQTRFDGSALQTWTSLMTWRSRSTCKTLLKTPIKSGKLEMLSLVQHFQNRLWWPDVSLQCYQRAIPDLQFLAPHDPVPFHDLLPLHGSLGHHGAGSTTNLTTKSLPGQLRLPAAVVVLSVANEACEQAASFPCAALDRLWMCCQVN